MLPRTRLAAPLVAAILASPFAPAEAQPPAILDSVYGGVSIHDIPTDEEGGLDGTFELRTAPVFGHDWTIEVLPTIGASVSFSGETNTAWLGGTARYMLTDSLFIEGFLGLSIHDADTPVQTNGADLGCTLLFREGAGLGYRNGPHALSLYGSHISHGGILCSDDANDGLTTLGIRYGYHFR